MEEGKGKSSLHPILRIEAEMLAEELYAVQLSSPAPVIRALANQYKISEKAASKILQKVRQRWRDEAKAQRPERRMELIKAIERNYRAADKKGDLAGALAALKALVMVEGLAVVQHRHTVTQAVKDEFEGRSERELEHYATHGQWPVQAPTEVN